MKLLSELKTDLGSKGFFSIEIYSGSIFSHQSIKAFYKT